MARALFFGFNPPFLKDGNVMPIQTDERLIKNDLLQLLLTIPGERVFRPDFGTELRRAAFEPTDIATTNNIRRSVLEAIRKFEPRVKVSNLTIERDASETQLNIKLFASVINDPDLEFKIELTLPIGPVATPAPPQRAL